MTARAREIIDFWTDVADPAARRHDRPEADVRAAELVRRCQDMASAEGLLKIDLEKKFTATCIASSGASSSQSKSRTMDGLILRPDRTQIATAPIRPRSRRMLTYRRRGGIQQPLQMLLNALSSLRFSASTWASLFVLEVLVGSPFPDIRVPFCRRLPSPAGTSLDRAIPEVLCSFELAALLVDDELVVDVPPDELAILAIPTLLVPGASGAFAELPAPLGSLPELFRPPTLTGPLGTPLTPAVPTPAEPAFGEPTALPAPFVGPLAAARALAPPDEPPPELPPPPPPPWARAEIDPRACCFYTETYPEFLR